MILCVCEVIVGFVDLYYSRNLNIIGIMVFCMKMRGNWGVFIMSDCGKVVVKAECEGRFSFSNILFGTSSTCD